MSKLSDYLMNNTPATNVSEGAAPGYEDDSSSGSSDDSGFSLSGILSTAKNFLEHPFQGMGTVIAPNYTPRPLDDSVYSDIPGTPVASGQFGELEDESVRDERMKDSADYMAANWPRLYGGVVAADEGLANVVGGIQNAVGGGNGILTNVQRAEEGMQNYRDQWNNEYGDSYFLNPNKFATDVGSDIGSTVPIMALSALMPGAAVAGGTRALTSALSRAGLGRLAMSEAGQALIADTVRSIPTSNLADSLSEYGTVVNDMMQNGMSEDEARRRAIPMFFKNMALDTFTVPLELGVMKGGKGIATGLLGRSAEEGVAKSIAKGAARTGMLAGASGLTEGYQEGAQNALENDVQGKRDGGWYNPFTWTNEDWEAARGGFVGGALMGVPGNVAAGFHPEAEQAPLSAESQEQAQSIKDTLSHGKPAGMSNAAYNAYIELANSGNPDLIKQAASSLESFQQSQEGSQESTDDAATEAYKDYEAYDQKQEIENFLDNNTVEQIGGEKNFNWLMGVLRNGTPEEVQHAYDTVIAAEKATAEQEAKNRPASGDGSMSPNTGNAMANIVIQAANDSGVEPRLGLAIAARESGGDDVNAISMPEPHDGVYGVMQAQEETVSNMGLDSQYPDWKTDPYQNAMVGMAILKAKIDGENGDVWAGVRDYDGAGEEAEQYRQLVKNNYDNMGDIGGGGSGNVEAPSEAFYDLSEAMNPQVDGMDPNTMAKMNLLARDFYQKYGHRLLVTSLKRNGDGSSYHDEGHAFDFSDDFLEQNTDARDWLVQQGEKYGLKGLDEFSHPVATTDGGNVHFTDHGGPAPGGASSGVSGKVTSDNGQFERELDQAAQEAKSDMDKIQAQSDQAINEIMNDDSTEKTAQDAQQDAESAQKQAEESQQSAQDDVVPDVAQTIRDTSNNIDEINTLDGMFTKDSNGNDKFIDTPENRDFIKTNYKDEIAKAVNDAMSKKKAPSATPVPKAQQQTPHARLGRILSTYDRKDPKFKEYMNTFRNGTEQEQKKLADDLQTTQELERANSLKGNPLTTQQDQNTPQNVPQQAAEATKQPEQVNAPVQVKESIETQKKRKIYLAKKQKLMERVPAGKTVKVHASANDAGFDATYKIVPAGDITASHDMNYAVNDLYPAEYQPRDRNRPQMRGQVEKMTKGMKPELLAESQFVNEGAPIVNNSGVVLNGNGRVMAVQKAYKGLTDAHKKSAKAYKDYLISLAPSLGIAPEKVQSMDHPVLVRQAADNADTNAIINSTEGGAKLGGAEQAKADADRLKLSTLEQFVDNGTGEFMNPSNREFRMAAASDVFSDAEGNSVFNENGDLSPTGQFRIRNAIFAKAYNDNYLLTQLSEATDNNSKNIMNAMIAAAPEVAKVNEGIKNGTLYPDYDISDVITKTAKTIMSLRNEGKPLSFHLQETDLFSQGESEAERLVLEFIERNKFKSRTIADMYKGACDRIFAVGSPKQSKLFDSKEAPRISLENIISNAIQEVEHGQSLFDTTEEKPAEKAVSEVPDNRQAEPTGSGRVHQQEAGRVQNQEKAAEPSAHETGKGHLVVYANNQKLESLKMSESELEKAKTVKAHYSDKGGGLQGGIKNGVMTIWQKKGGLSKSEWSFNVSIDELERALNAIGSSANVNATIEKIVKRKYNEATEKWIESSPTEKVKEKRRQLWEEAGGIASISDFGINVVKSLYEKAMGHKPESLYDKWQKQHKVAKGEANEESTESNHVNTEPQQTESKDTEGTHAEEGSQGDAQEEISKFHNVLDDEKSTPKQVIDAYKSVVDKVIASADGSRKNAKMGDKIVTDEYQSLTNSKHWNAFMNEDGGRNWHEVTTINADAHRALHAIINTAGVKAKEAPSSQGILPYKQAVDDIMDRLDHKKLTPARAINKLKIIMKDANAARWGEFKAMEAIESKERLSFDDYKMALDLANGAMKKANDMRLEASRKRKARKTAKELESATEETNPAEQSKEKAGFTDDEINTLTDRGFKRWTKKLPNGKVMDRLYIKPEYLGLELTRYKSGSISSAKFNGEAISNSEARRIEGTKCYVDVATKEVVCDREDLKQAAQEVVDDALKAKSQQEKQAPKEVTKTAKELESATKETQNDADIRFGTVEDAEARGRIDIAADDVNELFDRIEGMDMPERLDMSDEKKQASIRKAGQQLTRSKEDLKAEQDAENTHAQLAYHGTPHMFDHFDLTHIGSGYGVQAHGWGLYFAANKNIANAYKEAMEIPEGEKILYLNGKKYTIADSQHLRNVETNEIESNRLINAAGTMVVREGSIEGALKRLHSLANRQKGSNGRGAKMTADSIALLEQRNTKYKAEPRTSGVYAVDIPESNTMLDEQKTISEQPAKVKRAIYNMVYGTEIPTNSTKSILTDKNQPHINKTGTIDLSTLNKMTGKELYSQLANSIQHNQKSVSLLLNKYGIKGITYDGGIDGRCYVVFDDQAIAIQQRYDTALNNHMPELKRSYQTILANIKKAFPNGKIIKEENNKIVLQLPNGSRVYVDIATQCILTEKEMVKAKKEHGYSQDADVVAQGFERTIGKDGFIQIAENSTDGTEFHEAFHFAKDVALTSREKQALDRANNKQAKAEARSIDEVESDNYAKWRKEREKHRGTAFGRLYNKITDFATKVLEIFKGVDNVHSIFRNIESGEVWNRTPGKGNGQTRYSVREDDTERQETTVKPQDIIDAINDIVHIYEGSRLTDKERRELRESSKFDPDQKQAVRPQATDLYDRHAHAGFNRMGYFNLSNYGRILALHLDNIMQLKGNLELANKVLDRQDKNAAENKMNGVNERLTPAQARQNAVMDFGAMMIRNPELARETYPAYAKIFDEGLEQHPDLKEKLDKVIQLNETYQGQTAAERAAGSIAREKKKVQLRKHPKEWLHTHFDKFYTNWVDDKHIFAKAVARAEAELGRKLAYDYDVHKQAQMAINVASSRALLFLTGGKSVEETYKVLNKVYGHAITKNVTMKDIMDSLNKVSKEDVSKTGAENAYDALGNYLIAMRTEELEKHYHDAYARSAGFDEEGTQEIIQNTPESIKKIAQMYWDINTNIVNILQQQGLISKDLAGKLRKYKHYCPMYRDMSDGITDMDEMIGTIGVFNKGGGYANVSNGIKRIEGGGKRPILDPITSLSQMAVSMISKCERNDVAKTFVKLGQDFSGLGDVVVRDPTLKHADPTAFAFTVWQNGEQVVYRTTPEIYDALTNNDAQTNRFTIKMASSIAQTLRTGATISPSFIVRNLLRDTMSATVNSKTGFYLPFVDNVRGAWKLHFDKEFSAEYHASGASMSTYMRADADSSRDLTKELLGHKYDSYPVIVKQVRQLISYAWHKYEKFGNLIEDSTRAGEFRRARNQGLSIDQAGQLAREITLDFSRHGKKGQIVNKYVPFFNATIQGTDKFIRTFKDNPMRAILNTVIWVILPSLGLWAINHDDDWYKELDENTKYTNWAIPLPGGTHLLIPKPQEVGILFGSGIEAVLNQMTGTDPHGMKEWARQYAEAMTPSLYPAVVRPLIEWMTNYSFWTGRNLVPASLQKAPSEMQFTSYTSELAKSLGDTWLAKSIKLSPIAIDNWISGWFGSAGRFIANMLNDPISYVRGNSRPSEPAKYWYEMPVIGSFVRQNSQNSEYVNRMYEIQKDMNDDYERSDAGKQRKGKKSSSNKPKELKQVDTAVSSVSKLNKEIKAIRNDPKKDPDRKRQEIDQRRTKINDLAKKVVLKFDK